MLIYSTFILYLLILKTFGQSDGSCFTNPPVSSDTRFTTNFDNSIDSFGLEVFKKVGLASSSRSVILSPYSIWSILGLAYLGTDGVTRREMSKSLGIDLDKKRALVFITNLNSR